MYVKQDVICPKCENAIAFDDENNKRLLLSQYILMSDNPIYEIKAINY